MTVYVDVLFGLNAGINYLLLRGSAAVGGCPAPWRRLAAAAALGGLYAVGAVIPGWEALQSVGAQVVCAGFMLVTAFGWKRNTVKQGLFFFALSFAFGGAVLLLVQVLRPDWVLLGGRVYYALTTPALLLLAALCYGAAALVLSGCGTHTGGEIQPLTLTLGLRSACVRVLRDTGNSLRDPVTGQGVLVAGGTVLEQLLGERVDLQDPAAALERLSKRYSRFRFRLVPYRAVGTPMGLLLAVRCQGQGKTRRPEPVLVAFSPDAVSGEERFDAIWGGELE